MRLVHTKLARSIWLFDIRDLNPKGKHVIGELVAWIKTRYDFAVAPDPNHPVPNQVPQAAPTSQSAQPQSPGGLVFQRGNFEIEREEDPVEIASFTIYDDGIVIDTASSTEDGDTFADDLLRSATSEFKLSADAEIIRRRLYLSQLIVRSEMDLASISPALTAFAQSLPLSFGGGPQLPFGVGNIAFWSEPNESGQHRAFKIERQLGRAFSEQRFYAEATMKTHVHLKWLEEFEKAVMGL
jgi:hypothetical protein